MRYEVVYCIILECPKWHLCLAFEAERRRHELIFVEPSIVLESYCLPSSFWSAWMTRNVVPSNENIPIWLPVSSPRFTTVWMSFFQTLQEIRLRSNYTADYILQYSCFKPALVSIYRVDQFARSWLFY